MEVDVEVNEAFSLPRHLWRSRLNACHVNVVIFEDLQRIVKNTWFIRKREQDAYSIFHRPELNLVVWVTLAC